MTSEYRKPKTIIVGSVGLVGRNLFQAFRHKYNIFEHDLQKKRVKGGNLVEVQADPKDLQGVVMNIAIPWSEDFHRIVKEYHEVYKPTLIILHCCVPPGTTRKLNDEGVPAVHSSVVFDENRHDTMIFFRKLIGYNEPELGLSAEAFLRPCFGTALIRDARNTELADLCLGLYAMTCRAVTFEMSRMFDIYGLDYGVMSELLHYNNLGYGTQNKPNFMLQNIVPILSREDWRMPLLDMIPEQIRSAFFKLAFRSYEIEAEKRFKKSGEKNEPAVAKTA